MANFTTEIKLYFAVKPIFSGISLSAFSPYPSENRNCPEGVFSEQMNEAMFAKQRAVWLFIEGLNRINDIVPRAPLKRLIGVPDNAVIKQVSVTIWV